MLRGTGHSWRYTLGYSFPWIMMTSWHGNPFRISARCGSHTRPVTISLIVSLMFAGWHSVTQCDIINLLQNRYHRKQLPWQLSCNGLSWLATLCSGHAKLKAVVFYGHKHVYLDLVEYDKISILDEQFDILLNPSYYGYNKVNYWVRLEVVMKRFLVFSV